MVYRNNTGRLGFWLHQCVLRNTLAGSKTVVSTSRNPTVVDLQAYSSARSLLQAYSSARSLLQKESYFCGSLLQKRPNIWGSLQVVSSDPLLHTGLWFERSITHTHMHTCTHTHSHTHTHTHTHTRKMSSLVCWWMCVLYVFAYASRLILATYWGDHLQASSSASSLLQKESYLCGSLLQKWPISDGAYKLLCK